MNPANIRAMKQQIEEMEAQIKLAEEEEAQRVWMQNRTSSNDDNPLSSDVSEMLNLIRTEQSKMQKEVEHLLKEKVIPLEVRMDIFQSIMEQLGDIEANESLSQSGEANNSSEMTVEAMEKLEKTVDDLIHQFEDHNDWKSVNEGLKPDETDFHSLKQEEDIIKSLLASVTDLTANWESSRKEILKELQTAGIPKPQNEDVPKTVQKSPQDDRSKLIDTAKQLYTELCQLKEKEASLEPVIYANAKRRWYADRIKLVNGEIQTDDGKLWNVNEFKDAIETYPYRVFPDEEYEVECWLCGKTKSLKENLEYDGRSALCGGECEAHIILYNAKPGFRWVGCLCDHHFQVAIEEEPKECEFCETQIFHEMSDAHVKIPSKKSTKST